MNIYIRPKNRYSAEVYQLKSCVCFKQYEDRLALFHSDLSVDVYEGYVVDIKESLSGMLVKNKIMPEDRAKFDILNEYFYNEVILPQLRD